MKSIQIALVLALVTTVPAARAACCYFSAQDRDVNQPGQKAFITWEPETKRESFTVQPAFEGDARDFGMVVPTPAQPKLDEMPRDFFRHLALYTILLPFPEKIYTPREILEQQHMALEASAGAAPGGAMSLDDLKDSHGVRVLEAGVVGSLDYKIIEAERANGLYDWLKENKYSYGGDQATLDYYIQKKWIFTVMKIDTKQMKQGPDGRFLGEVTPTRFAFASDGLIYPLRITAISVKKNTEALFYVQAPEEMDLKDTWSWLWSYRVMWLMSGTVCISQKQMTPAEQQELQDRQQKIAKIKSELPGYDTTKLEWARRIGDADLAVLDNPAKEWAQGGLPDLPAGAKVISLDELKADFEKALGRLKADERKEVGDYPAQAVSGHPAADGVVVRQGAGDAATYFYFRARKAPEPEVAALSQLKGHIKKGMFLTKFRKSFLKHEMVQDLELVPVAKEFATEYLRILPQSPP